MMEAQLILANIAQSYQLRLIPDFAVELNPQITMSPLNGLQMVVEEREMVPMFAGRDTAVAMPHR
jgi:hypothetical protein